MRRLGLLGGMSWESSALYYRLANERVRDLLGGLHSADLVLLSVDVADVAELQAQGRWDDAGVLLGSTELELLLGDADADVPLLPTTRLHVEAAVDRALA